MKNSLLNKFGVASDSVQGDSAQPKGNSNPASILIASNSKQATESPQGERQLGLMGILANARDKSPPAVKRQSHQNVAKHAAGTQLSNEEGSKTASNPFKPSLRKEFLSPINTNNVGAERQTQNTNLIELELSNKSDNNALQNNGSVGNSHSDMGRSNKSASNLQKIAPKSFSEDKINGALRELRDSGKQQINQQKVVSALPRRTLTIVREQDKQKVVVDEPLFIRCTEGLGNLCKRCFQDKDEKVESSEEEIIYSSGESDIETRVAFQKMTDQERADRVAHLWKRAIAKTHGAVQVILTFGDLNRRIFLYGSTKKNQEQEEQEQIKPLPFILMPDSSLISFWNIVMMLLLLYTATYVPFKTAFVEDSPAYVNNIEFAIDSLFFVDLAVNFISAYETNDKNVEFRLSRISWMYLRTWFLFDVFSCIPFQYLDFSSPDVQSQLGVDLLGNIDGTSAFYQVPQYQHPGVRLLQMITNLNVTNPPVGSYFINGKYYNATNVPLYLQDSLVDNQNGQAGGQNYNKLVRLARLPRLYKLLRIMRLFKMVRLLKYNRNIKRLMEKLKMNPAYIRMITLTVTVVFLVHLVSCFYYMIVAFSDFEPNCWIVLHGLIDSDNFSQYISAMYWAFQTLTTVGYGDMQGKTMEERVFSILWILFGVAFYSFTIGNLQSILSQIDASSSELSQKLTTLTSFARQTQLPDNITVKIKKFLEVNNIDDMPIVQSRDLIEQLPAYIRSEVVRQSYIKIINKFRFLSSKDPDFLWAFLPILKPMQFYSKDILYSQGDHPEEVFFIMKGKIKLCHLFATSTFRDAPKIIVPFNMYAEGAYFGEMEMMLAHYQYLGRDGTAIVDSECHILVITQHQLRQILKLFPEVKVQMKQIARKRRVHHEKAINEAKIQALRENKGQMSTHLQQSLFKQSGNHILNQMQQGKIRKKNYERNNSLERAIRGVKKLERLEKNRKKMDHKKEMEMKNEKQKDELHDNEPAEDSQSQYSSDSNRSDFSQADQSRRSDDYSSDEEHLRKKKNQKKGSQSRIHDYKSKGQTQNQSKKKLNQFLRSDETTENEREDSLVTNSSKDTAEKEKKKKKEADKVQKMNIVENSPIKKLKTIKDNKAQQIKIENRDPIELDTIAEEENQAGDISTTSNGFQKGITIGTTSGLGNPVSQPDHWIKSEINASPKRLAFNNERQARMFNDTMAAIALNAFEINEVNIQIIQEGLKQKAALQRVEITQSNIDHRLDNIEVMLNKILQSV